MSKRGYISRYLLIIKKLKANPYSTFEEIRAYIKDQEEYLRLQDETLEISFSKRTLQRDIREIREVFGVDIEFSKANKGYLIVENQMENMNFQRVLEAYDLFNSLNFAKDLSPFVHLEKRKPIGTENIYGILHAIKHTLQIRFSYYKFLEDEIQQRHIEPYALKEFRSRWYVVGCDIKDGKIKSFALDRLSALDITKNKFQYPEDFNPKEFFRYSFGIVGSNNQKPANVVLRFTPFQGRYIKSLKLHNTQEVVTDNDQELVIKLKVYLTFDFVIELLSLGDNVKVLKPKSLIKEIKNTHERAFKQYQ